MQRTILTSVLAFTLTLLLSPTVKADIVIGNMGTTVNNNVVLGSGGNADYSAGWTMGNQDVILDSIDAKLDFTFGGGGSLLVEVKKGASPLSATTETFMAFTSSQVGVGTFTLTPVNSVVMEANSTYWMTMYGPSSSKVGWQFLGSNPASDPTGPLATSAGYRFNGDSVSTFQTSYQVNGTAVPEPASMGAIACAAIGLVTRRRRK